MEALRALPACARDDAEHRSAQCPDCQAQYARSRNERRRARRPSRAKKLIAPFACGEPRRRPDGDPRPPHRASECKVCKSARSLKWWKEKGGPRRARVRRQRPPEVAAAEDAQALARARVYRTVPPEKRVCAFCDRANARALVLEVEQGDLFVLTCRNHRPEAGKALALAQLRLAEGEDTEPAQLRNLVVDVRRKSVQDTRSRASRHALSYENALAIFQKLGDELRHAIVREASNFRGIVLSDQAPLYRQRFVALVKSVIGER